MPFDPESMKLEEYDWPLKIVVMLPWLSTVRTCAPPSALSDCVPMPNVIVPVTDDTPPSATVGICSTTPLLSDAKSDTGFWSCLLVASASTVHPDEGHE